MKNRSANISTCVVLIVLGLLLSACLGSATLFDVSGTWDFESEPTSIIGDFTYTTTGTMTVMGTNNSVTFKSNTNGFEEIIETTRKGNTIKFEDEATTARIRVVRFFSGAFTSRSTFEGSTGFTRYEEGVIAAQFISDITMVKQ